MSIFRNECFRTQDLVGKNISELRELFKNHKQEEVLEYHSNTEDYFTKCYLLNIAVEKGFKPLTYELISQIDKEHLDMFFDSIKSIEELTEGFRVSYDLDLLPRIKSTAEKLIAKTDTFSGSLDLLANKFIYYFVNLSANIESKILEFLHDQENLDTYVAQFKEFDRINNDDYDLHSPTLIHKLKELNALSIQDASSFLMASNEAKEGEEFVFSYIKSGEFNLSDKIPEGKNVIRDINFWDFLVLLGKFDLLKRIQNETELEADIHPKAIFFKLFDSDLVSSHKDRITIVKDYWKFIDKQVLTNQLTFDGMTPKQIDFKFAVIDLLREFATESDTLNSYETAILNPDDEMCLNVNQINFLFTMPQNSLGLSYFDLALLAGKADFAEKLLDVGFAPAAYQEGFTSLDFLLFNRLMAIMPENRVVTTVLKSDFIDVDKQDEFGQTPADTFIAHQGEIQDLVLDKSKDKIYAIVKGNYNDVVNESRANVAISIGEGFWSSAIFGIGRLLATRNDVDFYLVNMKAVEATEASIFSKFDGWINPGAGDTYPKDLNGFNLDSWTPRSDVEKMHFSALEHTDKLHIPYLGICAGAQHLSLYHGSNVKPVNLQASSRDIILEKASLPNFMALNSAEQKEALTSCAISVPRFKGDTAHSFALDESNVGSTLNVGAVSETGIPMLYVHDNGIRFGKQFHAEHYYSSAPTTNNIPQKEILDNFVSIAKMHFAHRVEGAANPEDIMQAIAHRLSECVEYSYFSIFEDVCPKSSEDVLRLELYIDQYFA